MDKEEFVNIVKAEGLTDDEAETMWSRKPLEMNLWMVESEKDPALAVFIRKVIASEIRRAISEIRRARNDLSSME